MISLSAVAVSKIKFIKLTDSSGIQAYPSWTLWIEVVCEKNLSNNWIFFFFLCRLPEQLFKCDISFQKVFFLLLYLRTEEGRPTKGHGSQLLTVR